MARLTASGPMAEEYRRQLGTALRAARKERRPEVATLLDWARQLVPPSSKDYISGVETGHHWPSRDFVQRYESACGIETGELVGLYDRLRDAQDAAVAPPAPRPRHGRGGWYAAVLAGLVGATALVATQRSRVEPTVSFTSLRSGATVCYAASVDGRWAGLPSDTDLWLVVRPKNDPRFYPQPGPLARTATGSDRRWTGDAYFGEAGRGVGDVFELEAVTATRSASATLLLQHLSHAGLAQLPDGARVRAAATVTRDC